MEELKPGNASADAILQQQYDLENIYNSEHKIKYPVVIKYKSGMLELINENGSFIRVNMFNTHKKQFNSIVHGNISQEETRESREYYLKQMIRQHEVVEIDEIETKLERWMDSLSLMLEIDPKKERKLDKNEPF
jgi:hypothetical protein